MAKVHEIVAVEKDVKGTFNKMLGETRMTFLKGEHFDEHLKEYQPLNADDREQLDAEHKPMADTVPSKLSYFMGHMKRMFDLVIQKEVSNLDAKADVTVQTDSGDEVVLYEQAPVAAIVQLTNLMESVRIQVLLNIPTLDPARSWASDGNRQDVFVTPEVRRARTKKVQVPIELSPATDRHPAQVQLVTEDVTTGHWVQKYWSGKISSADKSMILKRTDALIAGLKRAKSRANESEAKKVAIGDRCAKWILTGE